MLPELTPAIQIALIAIIISATQLLIKLWELHRQGVLFNFALFKKLSSLTGGTGYIGSGALLKKAF